MPTNIEISKEFKDILEKRLEIVNGGNKAKALEDLGLKPLNHTPIS